MRDGGRAERSIWRLREAGKAGRVEGLVVEIESQPVYIRAKSRFDNRN